MTVIKLLILRASGLMAGFCIVIGDFLEITCRSLLTTNSSNSSAAHRKLTFSRLVRGWTSTQAGLVVAASFRI